MLFLEKLYNRIHWKNESESLTTPLDADNLNIMDAGIDNIDSRLVELAEAMPEGISDLRDVTITSPSAGQILKWNGNKWVNGSGGGGGGTGTSDYIDLENKPKINGVELVGDKSSADLHIEGGGADIATYTAQEWEDADHSEIEDGSTIIIEDDYYEGNICGTVEDCLISESPNDVVGASALRDLVTYLSEERVVGIWIDGKPIYERIFTFSTSAVHSNWTDIEHGIQNVNESIMSHCQVYEAAGDRWLTLPFFDQTTWYATYYFYRDKIRYKNVGYGNGSRLDFRFILQYTKTTD